MFKSTNQLLMEYQKYQDPYSKIRQLVQSGDLIPLKRGLYETDPHVLPASLANCFYGPSYLSFEYALSWYGMIPERVTVYTSATFNKRRKKEFSNAFGTYTYQDVPAEAYPHAYIQMSSGSYPYLMAMKEKALCDELSIIPPIRGIHAFHEYLFEGMRLDENIFEELDSDMLRFLAPKYHKTNLDQLLRLLNGQGR